MATGNISLLDVAKNMSPSRETGIIMTYALSSHVTMSLPIVTVPGGIKKWKIQNDLAYSTSATAVRNLGSDFTATKTPVQPFSANIKIYGGKVRLDRMLKELAPEDINVQRKGQIAAHARQFTIDFFEGAGGSAMYGINNYITNEPTFSATQSVDAGDVSAGAVITLDMLDELLSKHNVVPGKTYMYMNDAPQRRIKKLSRGNVSGDYNVNYRPEEFGMFTGRYDNVPIITLKDGKGTDMLSNTEGDGSSTTVYVVTYGEDNVQGFQSGSMKVHDLRDKTVLEDFDIEHGVNFAPQAVRCISRLRYVKNAVS
jgi:hypothetical protein